MNANIPADLEYTENIRRDYSVYEEYLRLLNDGDYDKLREKFEAAVDRIKINARIKGIDLQ